MPQENLALKFGWKCWSDSAGFSKQVDLTYYRFKNYMNRLWLVWCSCYRSILQDIRKMAFFKDILGQGKAAVIWIGPGSIKRSAKFSKSTPNLSSWKYVFSCVCQFILICTRIHYKILFIYGMSWYFLVCTSTYQYVHVQSSYSQWCFPFHGTREYIPQCT